MKMTRIRILLYQLIVLSCLFVYGNTAQVYKIGVGRADVTGPAAEVTFMGYAKLDQKGQGIHLRQFARTFIVDDGKNRIVYVSVDAGMMGHGIRKEVLKKLSGTYGKLYTEQNVIISGTHTHSGPAGFLMDLLFDISSLGFVRQTFDSFVSGITRSIERAHNSMVDGKIYITSGELLEANINRSPTAYANNPEAERSRYKYDVDKTLVQMRMVRDNEENNIIGILNWFAVHPTSMNNTNRLISSDNVGYASILLEKKLNRGNLAGRGPIVCAFASTNLGDVSPNIRGPRCQLSSAECDGGLDDECPLKDELCVASGPGVDMFDSTKIIATRMFNKAVELMSNREASEVNGPVKFIHQFVDMPTQKVTYFNKFTRSEETVQGCLPAMGYSFAAGTTDGPGAFGFRQGTTTPNDLWNKVRDFIAAPTEEDIKCQGAKPILLATGEMHSPYEWQPRIVATQLALIGNVALAAVPGEFTTMSGRRLRDAVKEELVKNGAPDDVHVIVAGLSNIYSDYIVTPEEYEIQRYEGASTIFGPNTLVIYLHQYRTLAKALMTDTKLEEGPTPPDLSKFLITLLPPVIFDTKDWSKEFGDVVQQPQKTAKPGDVVTAKFVSGNPRNNVLHEKTFLTVEQHDGDDNWTVVATDADWETKFVWIRLSAVGKSQVEVSWEIKPETPQGEYRIRHFGYYKSFLSGVYPYDGVTNTFKVI